MGWGISSTSTHSKMSVLRAAIARKASQSWTGRKEISMEGISYPTTYNRDSLGSEGKIAATSSRTGPSDSPIGRRYRTDLTLLASPARSRMRADPMASWVTTFPGNWRDAQTTSATTLARCLEARRRFPAWRPPSGATPYAICSRSSFCRERSPKRERNQLVSPRAPRKGRTNARWRLVCWREGSALTRGVRGFGAYL